MPFVPVPDTALVMVRGQQASEVCEFTFAVKFPSAYDLTMLEGVATIVDDWAGSDLLPTISSGATYTGTAVRGLSASVDLETFNADHVGVGGQGSPIAAANVALVATKRSAFTGRSARGRCYLWGIPVNQVADARHVTGAYKTGFNIHLQNLFTALATNTSPMVVVSRQHNGVHLTTGVTYPVIQFGIEDTRLDSQRGRLGRS